MPSTVYIYDGNNGIPLSSVKVIFNANISNQKVNYSYIGGSVDVPFSSKKTILTMSKDGYQTKVYTLDTTDPNKRYDLVMYPMSMATPTASPSPSTITDIREVVLTPEQQAAEDLQRDMEMHPENYPENSVSEKEKGNYFWIVIVLIILVVAYLIYNKKIKL